VGLPEKEGRIVMQGFRISSFFTILFSLRILQIIHVAIILL
jgi:hypothetical protein